MTARIRHRWTVAGVPAFGQIQPHELAIDHGQRQLFTSEDGSGRESLIPVTWFDERATYAEDDIVAHQGLLWVAKAAVPPGPFLPAQWFKMNEADVGTAIDDAMAAHVADPDPHPTYVTDAQMVAHTTDPDPHPGYATDADLAAHVAAADPHPGYATDADMLLANPPGAMMMWPGAVAPPGWALCQGQGYNQATNPKLFAVLGTAVLPDMRGAVPRGLDAGRGLDPGRTLLSFQAHAFASHAHSINDPTHVHGYYDPGHAHSVYDPGHGHPVSDPGHAHTYVRTNFAGNYAQNALNWQIANAQGGEATSVSGSNISIVGAGSNIGIYGAGIGISISGAATGITVQANGANETRASNVALNFIIRLG